MLPKVIIYNYISLDGRINGFNVDTELYYKIPSQWNLDAVLMGSNTVLKSFNTKSNDLHEEEDFKVQKQIKMIPDLYWLFQTAEEGYAYGVEYLKPGTLEISLFYAQDLLLRNIWTF